MKDLDYLDHFRILILDINALIEIIKDLVDFIDVD